MIVPPSPEEIVRIVAFEPDSRPGVARLAQEALGAFTGVPLPAPEPVEIIHRPAWPTWGTK